MPKKVERQLREREGKMRRKEEEATDREKKRLCNADETGSRASWSWEGLNPEILALIFVRIPADELCRAVPFVCRSWREAVAGPYCWADVDVERWCRRCNNSDVIDTAVRKLVRRSRGTLRSLSAYNLGDPAFSFAANFGKCLKVLKIPVSNVSDTMVVKHAGSLSTITDLDISYCSKITYRGIEKLGQHCKSLFLLKRNMPLPDCESAQHCKAVEDEAMPVANTMPRLLHLELGYGRFSDRGLDAIVTNCKYLQHLDILGCCNVNFDGDLELRCERINVFRRPDDGEYDDESLSEDNGGSGSDEEGTDSEFYSDSFSDDSD